MSGERLEPKGQNEILIENLPEIAKDLNLLWNSFANTTIAFAGGGHFGPGPQPREIGLTWAKNTRDLLKGCTIPTGEENDWGRLITALNDLSEDLNLHFGPFRKKLPRLDRNMLIIRMNNNASFLLEDFKERGYLPIEEKPYNPRK